MNWTKSKYFSSEKHKRNYNRLSDIDYDFISNNLRWFNDTKAIYFASGDYYEEFHESINMMNVNKLVLVDYQFKESVIIDNIAIIALETTDAIKLFKYFNIKFDVFICLNDGVNEGGGWYSMHSNYFLAYVMPILTNPYIHIYSQEYLGESTYKHINDIGYLSTEIKFDDTSNKFLRYDLNHINMYKMLKYDINKMVYLNGNFKINIINKSIWFDESKLDRIYIRSKNEFNKFTRTYKSKNLYNKKNSIDKTIIIKIVNDIKQGSIVGSMPFGVKNYKKFLKDTKHLEGEINLYYLNKNDFSFFKNNLKLVENIKENFNELSIHQPNRYKCKVRFKNDGKAIRGLHLPPQLRIFSNEFGRFNT